LTRPHPSGFHLYFRSPVQLTLQHITQPRHQWKHSAFPVLGGDFRAIAYGNGTFVAVQGTTSILTSTDGATWKIENLGVNAPLWGIAYGGNTFAAVGKVTTGSAPTPSAILTSPTGPDRGWSGQ
jgi:hypothetical protein